MIPSSCLDQLMIRQPPVEALVKSSSVRDRCLVLNNKEYFFFCSFLSPPCRFPMLKCVLFRLVLSGRPIALPTFALRFISDRHPTSNQTSNGVANSLLTDDCHRKYSIPLLNSRPDARTSRRIRWLSLLAVPATTRNLTAEGQCSRAC
jgi:hypothetical protein